MKNNIQGLLRALEKVAHAADENLTLTGRLQKAFSGPFRGALRREATCYERIRSLRGNNKSARFHYRSVATPLQDEEQPYHLITPRFRH